MKHKDDAPHIDVSFNSKADGVHCSFNTAIFGHDIPAWYIGVVGEDSPAAFVKALRMLADNIETRPAWASPSATVFTVGGNLLAVDRREADACQRGVDGCCVDHQGTEDVSCESW